MNVKEITREALEQLEVLKALDVNKVEYRINKDEWLIQYKLAKPRKKGYWSQQLSASVKGKTLEEALDKLHEVMKTEMAEKLKERKRQAEEAQKKADSLRRQAKELEEQARLLDESSQDVVVR